MLYNLTTLLCDCSLQLCFTAGDMKCLKVDEYIKRTVSVKETGLLLQELQVSIIAEPGQSANF